AQRYRYILRVAMEPSTGTADVVLIDVGSGAVMATARATSPIGGERGFWGGRIGNTAQRNRVTYEIAQATLPVVEDILRGAAQRQR
ncbi:MAG: hypothetical protein HRU32_11765, partial [Rhodobacteraceae bacterium]|nr:hypothetical protein [Paracoccaceae bacterium]